MHTTYIKLILESKGNKNINYTALFFIISSQNNNSQLLLHGQSKNNNAISLSPTTVHDSIKENIIKSIHFY